MGLLDVLGAIAGAVFNSMERNMELQNRTIEQYEKKVDAYEKSHPSSDRVRQAREMLQEKKDKVNSLRSYSRRTDEEFENDKTGIDKSPTDFEVCKNEPLREAKNCAASSPGVYILFLNGSVMKCGRAAFGSGIRWRFQQYYNLTYDSRAQKGDYWAVSKENRDQVTVSWQCCPPSKVSQLEYKLFKKYGKGPWAQRAPVKASSDDWDLLI